MFSGCITDVNGISAAHETDGSGKTGCTLIMAKSGAIGAVDVRGGAPGTRETDAFSPLNLVDRVHAVMLCGGSAFGLSAADGAMQALEEMGIGFDAGVTKVPIVGAAVLFDLDYGDFRARPDARMGYHAVQAASVSHRSRKDPWAPAPAQRFAKCWAWRMRGRADSAARA